MVSIPQAVSTIAIGVPTNVNAYLQGFNTASGKYYCNAEFNGFVRTWARFQYRKR